MKKTAPENQEFTTMYRNDLITWKTNFVGMTMKIYSSFV